MASRIAKTPTGIGRQATIWKGDDYFQVRLHDTMVYEEKRDGTIVLCNGGWITPTTARYINQALDYREVMANVNIKGGEMYCNGQPFTNGKFTLKKAVA